MKYFGWSLISSFALTAAGSPIALLNGRASVSSDMLTTLDLYSQYAAASYCNSDVPIGSTVTCSDDACPLVTAAGAKVVATYAGSATDIRGFVSTDAKNQVIVVSVRGSHSIRNWITDLVFFQKDCSGLVSGCGVHSGFAKAWEEISAAVLSAVKTAKAANPAYKIVFTGHSLGGAPARRKRGVRVFRVGPAGREYRVTHLDDPVPRLPPIVLGYAHTTPEFWLSNGNALKTDYAVSDIKVCEGVRALGCNALTLGLNIMSHLYYLGPISGCSPDELVFKKRQSDDDDYLWWQGTSPSTDISDEDLEAQLNDWVQQDMQMVADEESG
ncbi:hypothetical protein E0Z10_g8474 [Xylaria hypoxylon]|uniref:Fungal lipase-type domain-containing protein n=1 Tax=Xylaria hypoxylon TaxID=37992 RepID=A0A4Z0YB89_9PEZI|nr:hypothetical protein E0Z10_g8474 [Xylaria hypoxylon]